MTTTVDLKQFEGRGFYPSFHALWHLKALGVATNLFPFESDVWAEIEGQQSIRDVSVAIIDGPISHDHPNLVGAIDLARMRDFCIHDDGEFLENAETASQERLGLADEAERLAGSGVGKPEVFRAIAERMRQEVEEFAGKVPRRRPPARPLIAGPHGTALAGLIGGRPAPVDLAKPKPVEEEPLPGQADVVGVPLPYAGVNPFCRIIPISTTVSPDPVAVEAALSYALVVKPDVVVMAVDWPDALLREKSGLEVAPKWQVVADLIKALADHSIVLCAAGNSGSDTLAFPAWLAKPAIPKLWAVTACTVKGDIVSYAPELSALPQMLKSLSTDAERYDRTGVLHDPWAKIDPEIDLPEQDSYLLGQPIKQARLGIPTSIVATDCPGPFGYNPSPYRFTPKSGGVHLEVHSLYCLISGTSAATGLAAGLVSLALSLRPKEEDGPMPPPRPQPKDALFDLDQAKAAFP